MEEITLGKKDGKICSWAKDSREGQVVDIINEMSNIITPEFMERIMSAPMAKCKSDSLFKFALEIGLTLDCIPNDLNIFCIAQDINTKESTKFILAPDKNEQDTITEMIKMINTECIGIRKEDNATVATDVFTIIANVVAQYCASDPQYKEAFLKVVKYWEDNMKPTEEPQK